MGVNTTKYLKAYKTIAFQSEINEVFCEELLTFSTAQEKETIRFPSPNKTNYLFRQIPQEPLGSSSSQSLLQAEIPNVSGFVSNCCALQLFPCSSIF